MSIFNGLNLGQQRKPSMADQIKNRLTAHIVDSIFAPDLAERRFENQLDRTAVSDFTNSMKDTMNMIGKVELSNPNYAEYFDDADKNVANLYDNFVKTNGDNPLAQTLFENAKLSLSDERWKHGKQMERIDERNQLKDKVRSLQAMDMSDPFVVEDKAASLFDEIIFSADKNVGEVNFNDWNTHTKNMLGLVDQTLNIASHMSYLDTNTDEMGVQLSDDMKNMRVTLKSGQVMSGDKAFEYASELFESGNKDRALSILENFLPADYTMSDLAKADYTKSMTNLKTNIDKSTKNAISAFNNGMGVITSGMRWTEEGKIKGEYDNEFIEMMGSLGMLDIGIKNVDGADAGVIQNATDQLGRGLYGIMSNSELSFKGRGQPSESGLEGSFTSAELRGKLLGTRENPGFILSAMGYRKGNKDLNDELDENEELRLQNLHNTMLTGDYNNKIFDKTQVYGNEEANKLAKMAELYYNMNDKITGIHNLQQAFVSKGLEDPNYMTNAVRRGDHLLKQDGNNFQEQVEANNDKNIADQKSGATNPNLGTAQQQSSNTMVLDPKSVAHTNLTRGLFKLQLDKMSIPKWALENNGKALTGVVTGYIDTLNSIKEFEQNSNLDDIIGKSVLATKDKPFHYSTEKGNTYTPAGGKEGIASESILGKRQTYDELQFVRSGQFKDLRKGVETSEKDFMSVMEVYEPNAIFPTFGPILNSWANMEVGDDGYNEHIVSAAKELQRSRQVLEDFSAKDNQQVKNLNILRSDIASLRDAATSHPQMKEYFKLKNRLEANKKTLSKMIPDEQDYADIMTAVMDAATYGTFSIQNGIIYLPEIDSLDDADPFVKDYETEKAGTVYSEDVEEGLGDWWKGSTSRVPVEDFFPDVKARMGIDRGDFDWWTGEHEIDSPHSGIHKPS